MSKDSVSADYETVSEYWIPQGSVVSEFSSVATPQAHHTLPYTYILQEARLVYSRKKVPAVITLPTAPVPIAPSTARAASCSSDSSEFSPPSGLLTQTTIIRETTLEAAGIPKEISFQIKERKIPKKVPKRFIKQYKRNTVYIPYPNQVQDRTDIAYWEHNTENIQICYEIPSHIKCMLNHWRSIKFHQKLASMCAENKFPLKQYQA